jgi:tripartite-type tricarboxylate transporter receptor subunit TctC
MNRWTSFAAAVVGFASLLGAGPTLAEYPDKPIKLIIPFPPGGGTDIIGRVVGDKLTSSLGWKLVVENKPGAGGTLGMDAAAKSKPDGYTMVLGQTSNLSIAPSLMANLPYDPVKAFTPITLVDEAPLCFLVGANSPIKNLSDLVAAAKAQPGKVLFASPGNATVSHLTGELFERAAGIKYTHVPYKGMAQALPDVISGRASFFITTVETATPQVKSGQLRVIATTGAKRAKEFPDVPTVAESGFKDFVAASWFGIVVPAGTPPPIVQKLTNEITKVLADPAVKERLGGDVQLGPKAFATVIKADAEKWGKVVKEAGIKTE